jgi:hypothetical protein
LYEVQGLNGFFTFIKEPFLSQGLFSKDSIISLFWLFDARGYSFFVVGIFGFVVLLWYRLNAAILSLCGGFFVFAVIGLHLFKSFSDTARVGSFLFGAAGFLILVAKFVNVGLWHRQKQSDSKILWPASPFLMIVIMLLFFAVLDIVVNQPSFERLARQGRLGILLLPCVVAFALAQKNRLRPLSKVRNETDINNPREVLIRTRLFNACVFLCIVFFTTLLIYFIFPRPIIIMIAFSLLPFITILSGVLKTNLIHHRNLDGRLRDLAKVWSIVLILASVLGLLPTYPSPGNWSFVDWEKEISFDIRGLAGSTGFMPDSSEVLGFHTKKDVLRCLELASMVPVGVKVFPVNGLQEFAMCQGTPGLNRGQLVHHYDSVLAPHFDEIIDSDLPQTISIFQKLGIDYLVVLKGNCQRFLISQSEAFDAKNLVFFRQVGQGADFMTLDIRSTSQVNPIIPVETFRKNLLEYSVCTK